ncbi:MAG: biopolymer transporter ExbD [Planctomycetes bacterium]|nr:biopolymer transporter ExbD [Planctomycetota bacterium]
MKRCLSMRRKHNNATIEMAPLIDIVFLLLIFYIVTASFVQESSVKLSRPESSSANSSTEPFVAVAVTKTGSVYLGGKLVSLESQGAFSKYFSETGAQRVLIQADREVPTALLLNVMDVCKAAGAESIDVAAVAKR